MIFKATFDTSEEIMKETEREARKKIRRCEFILKILFLGESR